MDGRAPGPDGRAEVVRRHVTDCESSETREQQARRLEAIGRLAGGVAHDFNNLLTAIVSFTRFVHDDLEEGSEHRADLAEVLKAADSAAQLTEQLLSFSRRRPIEPVTVDLGESVRGLSNLLRRTLGEVVTLALELPLRPAWVFADPGQLEQLILNLAVNARDAMPGGGTLTLSVAESERDEGAIVLQVCDTGEGIDAVTLEHIFEPFFSTKGEQGTGLGLATCYGIATQAGGDIEVQSVVGEGTTFRVLFPRAQPQTPEHRSAALGPARPPRPVREGAVLGVDDQEPIRRFVERALRSAGYPTVSAASAEEALGLIEDLQPTLAALVTDVVLPGAAGPELVEALRRGDPQLPVLMISGYAASLDRSAIASDPATSFLAKPFSASKLQHALLALMA